MNTIDRINNLSTVYGVPADAINDGCLHQSLDVLDKRAKFATKGHDVGRRVRMHEARVSRIAGTYFFWLGYEAERYIV